MSFPVFTDSTNSLAVQKINQMLQIVELELVKSAKQRNIFEQASFDDGTIYGGKVILTPTIYQNSDRLLSIGFWNSSCGATCAYWVSYYNFNPGNGDLIHKGLIYRNRI
ncbi:hypothetical protein [Xanthocytophaga flava]|uniref:hypothetical protein n=1 Tax=Xanthocytophaga flava TaxID=3048013 RepID=UPI0028D1A3E8|nr:hypothetical protein [Xanthocytophaga flavus]MDJ1467959.1 hypothetical protein [Xanthocytophaga flavus]